MQCGKCLTMYACSLTSNYTKAELNIFGTTMVSEYSKEIFEYMHKLEVHFFSLWNSVADLLSGICNAIRNFYRPPK